MPPVLGNFIALLGVAALVYACGRNLWLDHKRGGGCGSCGGTCGGNCAGCSGGCCGNPEPFTKVDPRVLRLKKR